MVAIKKVKIRCRKCGEEFEADVPNNQTVYELHEDPKVYTCPECNAKNLVT